MELASKKLDSDDILLLKSILPLINPDKYYPMVGSDSYVVDSYVLHIYLESRGIWIEDFDEYSKTMGRYKGVFLINKIERLVKKNENIGGTS